MIKKPLQNVDGELYIDGVSCSKLAEKFGTPLYVMCEKRIRENYKRLFSCFSRRYNKVCVLYSAKANSNISILRILKSVGAGIDAVSPGEVFLALKSGIARDKIFFTGTSVRSDELEYLFSKRVAINIDSLSQFERLMKIGTPDTLSVRINTEIGAGHHEHVVTAGATSKFGLLEESAKKVYETAKVAGVNRFGIHMHIGSGMLDTNPLVHAAQKLLETAKKIRAKVGINFDFIDFGGGIGVPYRPEEKGVDLEQLSRALVNLFRNKIAEYSMGEPEFWIEPGRYLVADAGILLTRVNSIKQTSLKVFAGVDAGFNTLIRPTMYGSYHHIVVVNKLDRSPVQEYDVVGPLCESGDRLAENRLLPKLSEGDLFAVLDAGAYGFSMSSQYNSRPRPAELLVKEGNYELIREREDFQDLLVGQRMAGWLKS